LHSKTRAASVQPDEEHQALSVVIEDRSGGYPKHYRADLNFVTTSEFRTLANSYQDVKDIKGPMVVKGATISDADEAGADEAGQAAATGDTTIGGAPLDEATKLAAESKVPDASSLPGAVKAAARKEADVKIDSV